VRSGANQRQRALSFCRKRAPGPIPSDLVAFSSTTARNGCSRWTRGVKVRDNRRGGCVARYYDPATGQFLSVDPAVALTNAPFNYAGDDPLDEVDPLGLSWLSKGLGIVGRGVLGVWRLDVDVPQDLSYAVYWGSYEEIKYVNHLGCEFGPVGSFTAQFITTPDVPAEALGLGGDVAGNVAKYETIRQEGQPDQPLLGNETIPLTHINVGKMLSNALGLPEMTFPGFPVNHVIDFAW
jgi:RHS repeat-associated protein